MANKSNNRTSKKKKESKVRKDAYLKALSEGVLRGAASQAAGVSRITIWEWRRKDAEFNAACEAAELSAVDAVEDALFQTALGGNVTAQQVWLYNRAPDRWADRRNVRHSGRVDVVAGEPVDMTLEEERVFAEVWQRAREVERA